MNLGDVGWYMECGVERVCDKGSITMGQSAFVDTLLARFDVTAYSNTPASPAAGLGRRPEMARPSTNLSGTVLEVPCGWRERRGRTSQIQSEPYACHSHDPREMHRKVAMKILAYLSTSRNLGITYKGTAGLQLSMYADAE